MKIWEGHENRFVFNPVHFYSVKHHCGKTENIWWMPDLNLAAVGRQEKWLITDTTTRVCVYEGEIIKTHKHTHILVQETNDEIWTCQTGETHYWCWLKRVIREFREVVASRSLSVLHSPSYNLWTLTCCLFTYQ